MTGKGPLYWLVEGGCMAVLAVAGLAFLAWLLRPRRPLPVRLHAGMSQRIVSMPDWEDAQVEAHADLWTCRAIYSMPTRDPEENSR